MASSFVVERSGSLKRLHVSVCLLVVAVGVVAGAFLLFRPTEPRSENFEVLTIVAAGSDYWELHSVNRTLAIEGITLTLASFTTGEVSGLWGLHSQVSFDEVDVSRYDVVFIPGGDGPENIIGHPEGQKAIDILVQANNQEKIIAAICHGPWVLAAADLVEGKNITCFPDADMKADLINGGANVDTTRSVVRDGNIITANGPLAVDAFTEEILNALTEGMHAWNGERFN